MATQWLMPGSEYVMIINIPSLLIVLLMLYKITRKYIEKHPKALLYLLFHVALMGFGIFLNFLILFLEFGHDFWGWDLPYLRPPLMRILYASLAIGIVFLVLFVDKIFGMNRKLRNAIIVYGLIMVPLQLHPANQWGGALGYAGGFDLREYSIPLYGLYVLFVGIVICISAWRELRLTINARSRVAFGMICVGGFFMIMVVLSDVLDMVIGALFDWPYNPASLMTWVFLLLAAVSFYFGYFPPERIVKWLEQKGYAEESSGKK